MYIFTLSSKFSYKGTPNDDLPTVTSIFKKVDNVWKIYWMQRSTGNSDLSLWDLQSYKALLMLIILLGSYFIFLINYFTK